jgi:hypothetical protein
MPTEVRRASAFRLVRVAVWRVHWGWWLGRYQVRPKRSMWSPQRAVRKSSRGPLGIGVPTSTPTVRVTAEG